MSYPAPALAQGLEILDAIVRLGRPSFSDLQRATGINANTLNRCLVTLCMMGFVDKRPDLKYTAGLRICMFDGAASVYQQLKRRARPQLAALVERYGITAILHGVQGERVYVLDKAMSPVNIAMNPVGKELNPLGEHIITPWGLVRMAHRGVSMEQARALVEEAVLAHEDTFDVEAILALYSRTQALGYTVDLHCFMPTLERIAFAVTGPDGDLIGIIGTGSYKGHLADEDRKALVAELAGIAAQLSCWDQTGSIGREAEQS